MRTPLIRFLDSGSTILDVGCGAGGLGRIILRSGIARVVVGVEDDANLARVASRYLSTVYSSDSLGLGFSGVELDVVLWNLDRCEAQDSRFLRIIASHLHSKSKIVLYGAHSPGAHENSRVRLCSSRCFRENIDKARSVARQIGFLTATAHQLYEASRLAKWKTTAKSLMRLGSGEDLVIIGSGFKIPAKAEQSYPWMYCAK